MSTCIIALESQNYTQFISTLQLNKIAQNEKPWNFKTQIHESCHGQIVQLELQSNQNSENLRQVIQLNDGQDQYMLFDSNIRLDCNLQKTSLTIIKSCNELMKILDSISAFERKVKKEVKGTGIQFEYNDFIIKIGEFKKNQKLTILLSLTYTPLFIIPTEQINDMYLTIFESFISELLSYYTQESFHFMPQLQFQANKLNEYMTELGEQIKERQKDPTKKDNEEKEKLQTQKINYFGQIILINQMIGLGNF